MFLAIPLPQFPCPTFALLLRLHDSRLRRTAAAVEYALFYGLETQSWWRGSRHAGVHAFATLLVERPDREPAAGFGIRVDRRAGVSPMVQARGYPWLLAHECAWTNPPAEGSSARSEWTEKTLHTKRAPEGSRYFTALHSPHRRAGAERRAQADYRLFPVIGSFLWITQVPTKTLCTACMACSPFARSITTEILISLVEIMSMLTPSFASVSNITPAIPV